MEQPADAAAMEGQAPNATAMEDQHPDAMAGPSLPLAVAALDATDARGLPVPIAQGMVASVDDVAAPEGSMYGEAPLPATAIQATAIPRFCLLSSVYAQSTRGNTMRSYSSRNERIKTFCTARRIYSLYFPVSL
jgi:hypothetical protein